jgi:hypothetical protein
LNFLRAVATGHCSGNYGSFCLWVGKKFRSSLNPKIVVKLFMPKLYEYLGLTIFFYSNEHEPVHVHARYQGTESKIEFIIVNGQISEIRILNVSGKPPLPQPKLNDFKYLAEKLGDEIVQNWINYFIYHKKIVPKKIQGKL